MAADFNGDGYLDLAVSLPQSAYNLAILLGNGNGTFQPAQISGLTSAPNDLAVADFDGDGQADLCITTYSTTTLVLLGKGDGTFKDGVSYAVRYGAQHQMIGDLNGDGFPDIVTANGSTTVINILLGNGDGHFSSCPEPFNRFQLLLSGLRGTGRSEL